MMTLSPMETNRLVLREIEESDLDGIHEYLSDQEVFKYLQHPNTSSIYETTQYIARFLQIKLQKPRPCYKFIIVLKESSLIAGECSIYIPNHEDKAGEVLYRLNKKFWGKGYTTEATERLIKFGFEVLKLHRIQGECDKRNVQSSKILEKLGMKFEGCLREHKWIKDKWRDTLMYSILDYEYNNAPCAIVRQ